MLTSAPKLSHAHPNECGLTLIEVMIALLVASVGLFALAGLQSNSFVANGNTYRRSQAVLYGNEIAERMRANPTAVNNGAYDSASGTQNTGCNNGGCGVATMAANDLFEWSNTLSQLPEGQGVVCIDSTPDDGTPGSPACDGANVGTATLRTIKVFWQENGARQRYAKQVRIDRQ